MTDFPRHGLVVKFTHAKICDSLVDVGGGNGVATRANAWFSLMLFQDISEDSSVLDKPLSNLIAVLGVVLDKFRRNFDLIKRPKGKNIIRTARTRKRYSADFAQISRAGNDDHLASWLFGWEGPVVGSTMRFYGPTFGRIHSTSSNLPHIDICRTVLFRNSPFNGTGIITVNNSFRHLCDVTAIGVEESPYEISGEEGLACARSS